MLFNSHVQDIKPANVETPRRHRLTSAALLAFVSVISEEKTEIKENVLLLIITEQSAAGFPHSGALTIKMPPP